MTIRSSIVFAAVLAPLAWAADDALLKYLEPYPYYSSEIAIPKDLIERVREVAPNAADLTFRQASLILWHFDRVVSIRRIPKEGPEYFEPGIGPQLDGWLCTIRLFPNSPSSINGTRHIRARIDKIVFDKERHEKRCGALIPTKDGSRFYTVDVEAGSDVTDKQLSRIITIVSDYAGK